MFNTTGIGLIAALTLAIVGNSGDYSKYAVPGFVVVICVFLWQKKSDTVYRDLEPARLTHPFQSSGLHGIFSTDKRVQLLDSTLARFRPIIAVQPDPTMIAANSIPGMNFLLNASQGKRLFWRWRGGFSVHQRELSDSNIQDFILLSKFNPRLRYWPNFNKPACDPRDCDSYNYYLEILESETSDFTLVAENEGFLLYAHHRVRF